MEKERRYLDITVPEICTLCWTTARYGQIVYETADWYLQKVADPEKSEYILAPKLHTVRLEDITDNYLYPVQVWLLQNSAIKNFGKPIYAVSWTFSNDNKGHLHFDISISPLLDRERPDISSSL